MSRILAVAYACEPNTGSEPGVGWNFVTALAQKHDVVVVTRRNNRDRIEQVLTQNPCPSLQFRYVDAPAWARWYKRGNRGVHLYQLHWQTLAFLAMRKEGARRPFDIVHQVTFTASWYPSLFAWFPATFVWGPLANNQPVPAGLASSLLDRRERFANWVRAWLRSGGSHWNPLLQIGRRRAKLLIAISDEVRLSLRPQWQHKTVVLAAVGLHDPGSPPERTHSCASVRAVMVGRLMGLKGFALALQAMAQVPESVPLKLDIIGDGRRRAEFEGLAARLGLQHRVRFLGELTYPETMRRIADADLMLFPSFEAAGLVVIEAMASGVPVVCLDAGGPGEFVQDEGGIRVTVGDFPSTVMGLAEALERLACDQPLRLQLGDGARHRFLEHYDWRIKAQVLHSALEKM